MSLTKRINQKGLIEVADSFGGRQTEAAPWAPIAPASQRVTLHAIEESSVTTSVALVTRSDVLVSTSFLFLVAWHLLLEAMHLFLIASCYY